MGAEFEVVGVEVAEVAPVVERVVGAAADEEGAHVEFQAEVEFVEEVGPFVVAPVVVEGDVIVADAEGGDEALVLEGEAGEGSDDLVEDLVVGGGVGGELAAELEESHAVVEAQGGAVGHVALVEGPFADGGVGLVVAGDAGNAERRLLAGAGRKDGGEECRGGEEEGAVHGRQCSRNAPGHQAAALPARAAPSVRRRGACGGGRGEGRLCAPMIVQKFNPSRPHGLPAQAVIALSFLAAILAGAVLLALPASHVSGRWGGVGQSLFLSVSAICVTGLSPVADLPAEFGGFGLAVLMLLAQTGALGIMTLGTFIIEAMGRRASMKEEQMLMESFGTNDGGGVESLLLGAVWFTLAWEAAGAVALAARFRAAWGLAPGAAAWHGLFHSVMAFCNAGFSLYPDSVARYASDPVVLGIFGVQIVVGGIGFIVHRNVFSLRPWRRNRLERGRLTLHSRIVLQMTIALLALGTVGFWLLERHGAFAGLSPSQQWLRALFKTASTRTCGFAATPDTAVGGFSKALSMVLMSIGGAPGSTCGGLKVTTVAVLLATVRSMARNLEECEIGHRTIPARIVRESIAILMLGLGALATSSALLHVFESRNPAFFPPGAPGVSVSLVFEAVSAFGTVGLSLGATPELSGASRACLVACMFLGRLGPLTLALTMGGSPARRPRRYPEESVVVG